MIMGGLSEKELKRVISEALRYELKLRPQVGVFQACEVSGGSQVLIKYVYKDGTWNFYDPNGTQVQEGVYFEACTWA